MMPVNVFGMKIDLQKLLLMPRVNLEYICFQCSKGLRSEVGTYLPPAFLRPSFHSNKCNSNGHQIKHNGKILSGSKIDSLITVPYSVD